MSKSIARRRVGAAKFDLMRNKGTSFFSALLSHKRLVEDPGCQTAWTDGFSIGYNPVFFEKISIAMILWVLLHELGHIIYDHIPIAVENKLNMNIHNIAGDHYINLWLKRHGFTPPDCIKIYCDHKYDGWSTQKIYLDLLKNPPPPDSGGMGMDIRCPPGMTKQDVVDKIMADMTKATIAADSRGDPGSVPGDIRRAIDDWVSPQLPWDIILQNEMQAYAKNDYTWTRPNRRYMPDFYLPSLYSNSMGHMLLAEDVSGSITQPLHNLISAEMNWVKNLLKPESLRMITFDTKIHHNQVYGPAEDLPRVLANGGGGTNVEPVLEYIRNEDPVVSLLFTDGRIGKIHMDDISSDVIWVVTKNPEFNPPKGKVIHLPEM